MKKQTTEVITILLIYYYGKNNKGATKKQLVNYQWSSHTGTLLAIYCIYKLQRSIKT